MNTLKITVLIAIWAIASSRIYDLIEKAEIIADAYQQFEKKVQSSGRLDDEKKLEKQANEQDPELNFAIRNAEPYTPKYFENRRREMAVWLFVLATTPVWFQRRSKNEKTGAPTPENSRD